MHEYTGSYGIRYIGLKTTRLTDSVFEYCPVSLNARISRIIARSVLFYPVSSKFLADVTATQLNTACGPL